MVLANLVAFLDVQPEMGLLLVIDVGFRQAFIATTNATVGAEVVVQSAISLDAYQSACFNKTRSDQQGARR